MERERVCLFNTESGTSRIGLESRSLWGTGRLGVVGIGGRKLWGEWFIGVDESFPYERSL